MKAIEQSMYFPVVLFIVLYKVVSVDEIISETLTGNTSFFPLKLFIML